MDYGFIPASNNSSLQGTPAGCVSLGLRLNDKLAPWKRELLSPTAAAEARLLVDGLPGTATTATLRIAMAEHPDDILPAEVPFGGSSEDMRPIKLLRQAVGTMLAKLAHYNVQDDIRTLRSRSVDQSMPIIESLALRYRIREKLLLELSSKKLSEMTRNIY